MLDPTGYFTDEEILDLQAKCCKAEDPKDLEDRIMNCNIPKSAAEWWAKEKISKLNERIEALEKIKRLARNFIIDAVGAWETSEGNSCLELIEQYDNERK